jgi:hypothetical protein
MVVNSHRSTIDPSAPDPTTANSLHGLLATLPKILKQTFFVPLTEDWRISDWMFALAAAAYNLVRIRNLATAIFIGKV